MAHHRPDEVAVFDIFDNQGKPSIAYGAVDLLEDEIDTNLRKCIESCTLVRY